MRNLLLLTIIVVSAGLQGCGVNEYRAIVESPELADQFADHSILGIRRKDDKYILETQDYNLEVEVEHNPLQLVVRQLDEPISFEKKEVSGPRDFYTQMSPKDKSELYYILDTLANNSILSITYNRKSLEAAGLRIDHIHPLQALFEIFTDPKLKTNIKKIRQRSLVWNAISQDYAKELSIEHTKYNNVLPHLEYFATNIGVDIATLSAAAHKTDWVHLFELLIAI